MARLKVERKEVSRLERNIRLLDALKDNFQEHVNRPFGNHARGEFSFSEEEMLLLRDACREEAQRLKGH